MTLVSKLDLFSIAVMADGSLGDPADPRTLDRKIALISQYSIDPRYGFSFVQNQRHNFDSYGNLSPSLVGELRYCAQPVQRALAEFSRQYFTMLRPPGFVHFINPAIAFS